jgi:hypothetical protein
MKYAPFVVLMLAAAWAALVLLIVVGVLPARAAEACIVQTLPANTTIITCLPNGEHDGTTDLFVSPEMGDARYRQRPPVVVPLDRDDDRWAPSYPNPRYSPWRK